MRTIVRTELAETDFEAILAYLDEHSPAAAERLATEIDETCRHLAAQPRMGRPRDDLSVGLRSIVVQKYLVFFRSTVDTLVVVRILHGARDQSAIDWEE